jgi:hypothetical protein
LRPSPDPSPIVLNVGITGHRANLLEHRYGALQGVVDKVFQNLRDATLKIQGAEVRFCSITPAELRLHTGLASGADQIAAESARSSGYRVHAVLPFSTDEYRDDFAAGDELDAFERALAAADEIVALPGTRAAPEDAYVLVGKAVVEAADVIVAIWDGQAGRGPGGTAHVVEMARESSVPVIHIGVDQSSDKISTRILIGEKAIEPKRGSQLTPASYYRLLRGALSARHAATGTASPGTGHTPASASPA